MCKIINIMDNTIMYNQLLNNPKIKESHFLMLLIVGSQSVIKINLTMSSAENHLMAWSRESQDPSLQLKKI